MTIAIKEIKKVLRKKQRTIQLFDRMRNQFSLLIYFLLFSTLSFAQTRTIHVFVALCDNKNQGIVPVPAAIGNGQDPARNLYWGAGYGVKSFFKNKTTDWKLVKTLKSGNPAILERVLFKHTSKDVYMLADAYDGAKIKVCTANFFKASNGQVPIEITLESATLKFGGGAQLIAYIGHDGLMEFNVNVEYRPIKGKKKDVIILACYSKDFFYSGISQAKANPILWTKSLMAPEAYSLKGAIDGWILNETGDQIHERAAVQYNKYQKCGMKGARHVFTTGFD